MTILNLFIPRAALADLSIPELAVTDGSGQPEWVDFPCLTAWAYSRPTILRLPLDAYTAAIARRWIRFHRMERAVLRPAFLALGATSLALVYFGDIADLKVHGIQLTLLMAAFGLLWWAQRTDTYLTVRVHPEVFASSGVHIPGVPQDVAQEWIRQNSGVRATDEIPTSGRSPGVAIMAAVIVGTVVAFNLLPEVGTARIVFAAISLWALAGGFLTALRLPASVRTSRRL